MESKLINERFFGVESMSRDRIFKYKLRIMGELERV